MSNSKSEILVYVDSAWLAEYRNTTKQSVGKSAKSALEDGYRGDFPRPDAIIKGRTGKLRPLWLASRFEGNDDA